MPNQKSTTSRALAFWFGLTLHLALGAALYHQTTVQSVSRAKQPISKVPAAPMPQKP